MPKIEVSIQDGKKVAFSLKGVEMSIDVELEEPVPHGDLYEQIHCLRKYIPDYIDDLKYYKNYFITRMYEEGDKVSAKYKMHNFYIFNDIVPGWKTYKELARIISKEYKTTPTNFVKTFREKKDVSPEYLQKCETLENKLKSAKEEIEQSVKDGREFLKSVSFKFWYGDDKRYRAVDSFYSLLKLTYEIDRHNHILSETQGDYMDMVNAIKDYLKDVDKYKHEDADEEEKFPYIFPSNE
jgi:hypothetical protein